MIIKIIGNKIESSEMSRLIISIISLLSATSLFGGAIVMTMMFLPG